MNDQAKDILAQMMQRTLDSVDAAVEFGQQQIPIVIEQLLTWHYVEAMVVGLLQITIVLAWCFACYRFRPGQKIDPSNDSFFDNTKNNLFTDKDNDVDPRVIFTGIASLIIFAILTDGVTHLLDAVKIAVAPKLYLLEYGATLVNGKG